MSDQFAPIPFPLLVELTLTHIRQHHFFGIPEEKFYKPAGSDLSVQRFGKRIGTPLGVAAGPHSQMAQNIVAAWLCGARYIELKTVQTLDQLTVSKPCIDMQDEGYNCEWSQELSLDESFSQYLDAWILIHILHRELGFSGQPSDSVIFNMSVGYNLEGILKPNVQHFLDSMADSRLQKKHKINQIASLYPAITGMTIPDCLSDNVTLSTMHGCPSDEIEKIGSYLIRERKLHTIIKLNPTLLGPEKVRTLLNQQLGYKTPVPDQAFDHDLKYPDALQILANLAKEAALCKVGFGVKLTNTLESLNFKKIFSGTEKQMYMSGRALHPIAISLALKLRADCGRGLDISFSAGADAFNVADVLACAISPVTVCSDLLKPGGYARLHQYIGNLNSRIMSSGYHSLSAFMDGQHNGYLAEYANSVVQQATYRKPFREPSVKTPRPLGPFDCIHAPCVNTCPTNQDIPEYLYHAAQGDFEKAFDVILRTNPFPGVTGTVCDHECQTRCTRTHYDNPVAIREVKRFISQQHEEDRFPNRDSVGGIKASVIGAGPSGLSCAWYLRQAGFNVTVYEAGAGAGGMVSQVIPDFRISRSTLDADISRIVSSGVNVVYNHRVDKHQFNQLVESGHYVYLATGSPVSKPLGIKGEEADGVLNPLDFLSDCKEGRVEPSAKQVVVIGGGNTAMDVARAARRTLAVDGSVALIYRRSRHEMPAETDEILAALAEGVTLIEMASPVEVLNNEGRVAAIRCVRTLFSGEDADGRAQTTVVEGSDFELEADVVIPAVGQSLDHPLADPDLLKTGRKGYATKIPRVYVGGDARHGAANIIGAVADGRKAAQSIAGDARKSFPELFVAHQRNTSAEALMIRKSVRQFSNVTKPTDDGHQPLITTTGEAMAEAARCLLCDEICNICVTVCPNLANQGFETEQVTFSMKKGVRAPDGTVMFLDDEPFVVNQRHQVFNIGNFCNECGNCTTFCPTSGSPYRDKPTFWLTSQSFEEADEGYFIEKEGEPVIIHKFTDGSAHVLRELGATFAYNSPGFSAIVDKKTFEPLEISFHNQHLAEASLHEAASLSVWLGVHNVLSASIK